MFASNIGGKNTASKLNKAPCFLVMIDAKTRRFLFVKKVRHTKTRLIEIALVCIAFGGCAGRVSENTDHATDVRGSESKTAPMRIVTDDLDRRVTIPTKVQRVVSLAPSVTESVFAVGAGDRLVGVTTFCNYPEEAKSIQKVGDTLNPSIETIVALKPDIVFVSSASQLESFMNTLEKNGITVYVMNPGSFDGVIHNLEQLGIIFGTTELSQKLVRQLEDREQTILRTLGTPLQRDDKRVGTVRVFVQISKEPLFTIGKDAFLNDLLLNAGGRSVTESVPAAFPKLSKETALALQPEAIILSDSSDNQEPNEVLRNSPAVKNGRVYKIDADIISRPGPRLIEALEQIAKMLHPEKFPE
jgi:iron complex transport system substrate-binding protein